MSREKIAKFTEVLQKNNYRITDARKVTFSLLLKQSGPVSMRQLIDAAGNKLDRVSIYRNIELFEKLGIVNRITVGWKYKLELSDLFVSHHHHLHCLECDESMETLDEAKIEDFITKLAAETGFVPRNHVFEVDGYCKKCTKQL